MLPVSNINQKGRSMVEMLGVLAIIGVLSVGGISGYSKAMAKFKLTKAQDQITMLLMNIRTAFATNSSHAGLTSKSARDHNIAPSDMFDDNEGLNNAFGGKAHVYACNAIENDIECIGAGTGSPQHFAISLTNLGREACVSLATSDWGTDGLVGLKINDTTNFAPVLPLNISVGGNQCKPSGELNTITWTYY